MFTPVVSKSINASGRVNCNFINVTFYNVAKVIQIFLQEEKVFAPFLYNTFS